MNKVYLGTITKGLPNQNEAIYLTKHEWACNWYWAFGYIGNRDLHFHFEDLICPEKYGKVQYLASEVFQETNISDDDWWAIKDLFIQAYALKKAAEVYQYGGHQTTREGVTDLIKNLDMAKTLNSDLERVLDKVWEFVCEAAKSKEVV